MSFLEGKLADVLVLHYGKSLPERKRVEGKVPVYGSGGIGGFHNEALVKGPGVIVGRKGTIGSVYYEKNDFFPIDTVFYAQPKSDELNLRFAYYLLKGLPLEKLNTDAAVPGLNRGVAYGIKIKIPDKKSQLKIVSVIGAYDDLIENNSRRIRLLEDSALQMYKEWFIKFRFPGHEHKEFLLGIPSGWHKKKISEICIVGRGASPRPIKEFMGGDIPWFKIGDATASESPFIYKTKECVIESGAKISVWLKAGELILSNSATCGVPNFTGVSGCIHDGWLYFKELKLINKWFFYLYLVFKQQALLQGIGDGATQKNLNTTYVGNQDILIPNSEILLESFSSIVISIFENIQILAKYNSHLAQARDLLSSRLLEGKITL